MVRNYVRTSDRSSYTKESLDEAVDKVKKGELSGYGASLKYKIPRSTIMARVKELKGIKSTSMGRSTVLTQEVEQSLANSLHLMEKHGFGLTRMEILELVGDYIKHNNIPNPFNNNIPGDDWLMGFRKRNNLSIKKPQGVEQARKNACNPFIIYQYFEILKNTLDELNLHDKSELIWNLDETSFSKDPCKTKIVGRIGFPATRTISTPGKENTTVLLGCSASGQKTPPLIIYKGKYVWNEWVSQEDYPGTVYAATANGWMETSVFEAFFDKVFLPTIGERRPVLLIYDGHSTHVGINIIEKARNANVTILKLPPHTSHILQPLDLAVNKSVKDRWDRELVKWQRLNVGKVLPKKEFSRLLGQIWSSVEPKVCAAGFHKGGIVPFNMDVIPESNFNTIQMRDWKNKNSVDSDQTRVPPGMDQSSDFLEGDLRPKQPQEVYNPPSLHQLAFNKTLQRHCRPTLDQHHSLDQFERRTNLENKENGIKSLDVTNGQSKIVSRFHDISLKTSNTDKVMITSDFTVKTNTTFEELLLKTIKPGKTNKMKRKRIAPGAEVITRDEVFKKLQIIEEDKILKNKKANNGKDTKKNRKLTKKIQKLNKSDVLSRSDEEKMSNGEDQEYNENSQILKNEEIMQQKGATSMNKNKPEKNKTTKKEKKIKKTTKRMRKKQNKEMSSSSDDDDDEKVNWDEESDQDYNDYCRDVLYEAEIIGHFEKYDTENEGTINIQSDNLEGDYDDWNINKFIAGHWVLVKFATKKTLKYYVGKNLHVNKLRQPTVKFTRKCVSKESGSTFVFPQVEDIMEIRHLDDIVCRLPDPVICRRGQIVFKMSFEKYNIY